MPLRLGLHHYSPPATRTSGTHVTGPSEYNTLAPPRSEDFEGPRESSMPSPRSAPPGQYGEDAKGRTIFTIGSLVCIILLASMIGSRASYLRLVRLRSANFIRIVVLLIYALGLVFVVSATVVASGLGLGRPDTCYAAIMICVTFYIGSKVAMYVFLIERAHALRAPYIRRTRDRIWVLGMTLVLCGFGSIGILAFIYPVVDVSGGDGKCRIGLPFKVTIPLLSFDAFINLALTGVFIYLLRPLLSLGPNKSPSRIVARIVGGLYHILSAKQPVMTLDQDGDFRSSSNIVFMRAIELLLWKSLIGAFLVIIPTIINMSLLARFNGHELGWLCLTLCTFDVTWGISIVHWLTVDPMDAASSVVPAHQLDS